MRKWTVIGLGLTAVVAAVVVPVIGAALVGYLVSLVAPLSWYASPWLAFFLYGCPTTGLVFGVHHFFLSGKALVGTCLCSIPGYSVTYFVLIIDGLFGRLID